MSSNLFWVILFAVVSTLLMRSAGEPLAEKSFSDGQSTSDDISSLKRQFFVGSRYGRSPQVYKSKARRLSVAPRNDRFFLGSRYGKRSGPGEFMLTPFEQEASNQSNVPFVMNCVYTGIKNFFKCNSLEDADMQNFDGADNETK